MGGTFGPVYLILMFGNPLRDDVGEREAAQGSVDRSGQIDRARQNPRLPAMNAAVGGRDDRPICGGFTIFFWLACSERAVVLVPQQLRNPRRQGGSSAA